MSLNNNRLKSIYVHERKKNKNGELSKRETVKLNRSDSPITVSLGKAIAILENNHGIKLDKALKDNIDDLVVIRDNSIHFTNDDFFLAKRVQEIGTASLRNYLHLIQSWFGMDMSQFNFYLMPVSFFQGFNTAKMIAGVKYNEFESNFIQYINQLEGANSSSPDKEYNLMLELDIKLKKSSDSKAMQVQVSRDPTATKVRISEEDMLSIYSWDYSRLVKEMKKKYSDFKQTQAFHDIRKEITSIDGMAYNRKLNPNNPSSKTKQVFYNPNIMREFDKHYTKK